jgi:N utilization substance protein B
MSRRSRAREIALQVLYQDEFNPSDEAREREFLRSRLNDDPNLIEFAGQLLAGVREHRASIDEHLKKWSARWDIARMAAVDRNILRLGTFEIVWLGTPKPVAVNEAILLAKRYGNQQSFQFINGILDRLTPGDVVEPDAPTIDRPE